MRDVKLPDGTWATTPIAAGLGAPLPPCDGDTCEWKDFGPPLEDNLVPSGSVPVRLQRCSRCQWMRGRYLDNPDPED